MSKVSLEDKLYRKLQKGEDNTASLSSQVGVSRYKTYKALANLADEGRVTSHKVKTLRFWEAS